MGNRLKFHIIIIHSHVVTRVKSKQHGVYEETSMGCQCRSLPYGCILHDTKRVGQCRLVDSLARGGGYSFDRDSIATRPGFARHWDCKAKAPCPVNEETNQLVTFDDEESVKLKCAYVREKKWTELCSGSISAIRRGSY